jgi:NodT family efflux transporter outer membrane factor (OMF) lipoprotein
MGWPYFDKHIAVASTARRTEEAISARSIPCRPHRKLGRSAVTIASLFGAAAVGACALGPDYEPPPVPVPYDFQELPGWKIARPSDGIDRGDWWAIYGDPTLDSLERQVDVSNQNIAAAEAAYRQSVALVRQARSELFPTIGLRYSPNRWHEGAAASDAAGDSGATSTTKTTVTLDTLATWDIDVWGRIRRTIESNVADAQASAADLANAKLLAQTQLALAYFNLRAADSLQNLLDTTVNAYKRTLTITKARFDRGVVSRYDVIASKTQLRTTEALAINVGIQRAQLEHAIAVLIGVPPSDFSIAEEPLLDDVPYVPTTLPSLLLERRPDIAAAERRIAGQNALIGVAVAAYFPDISLSGLGGGILPNAVYGFVGTSAFPIAVANEVWSVGLAAVQTIIDGGLRKEQVAAALAAYYQRVAIYRQTVLTAFQQVEDELSNLRILADQQHVQDDAERLSRESLDIALSEYGAGTVSITAIVQAQEILLSNEQAALATLQGRYIASVSLIQALGGGWHASQLPGWDELTHWRSCVRVFEVMRGHISPELPPCL